MRVKEQCLDYSEDSRRITEADIVSVARKQFPDETVLVTSRKTLDFQAGTEQTEHTLIIVGGRRILYSKDSWQDILKQLIAL